MAPNWVAELGGLLASVARSGVPAAPITYLADRPSTSLRNGPLPAPKGWGLSTPRSSDDRPGAPVTVGWRLDKTGLALVLRGMSRSRQVSSLAQGSKDSIWLSWRRITPPARRALRPEKKKIRWPAKLRETLSERSEQMGGASPTSPYLEAHDRPAAGPR